MKKISLIFTVIFATAIMFTSCKDKSKIKADIVPSKFKVDIPSSISDATSQSDKDGILDGNDIYGHLRTFIAIGEGSANFVQTLMDAIREYELDQAMSFSYTSDEDGRIKNVEIIENSIFEGQTWEYQLTITDQDGGKALQIFWNNSPVKGISILNPYNINRNGTDNLFGENTMCRIDYSEVSANYEAEMTVYIAGLVLPDTTTGGDRFAMETLKMFVGKKGDIVDVYGNSNHPNAYLFDETTTGFNWAFAASGDDTSNIGIAEVGLPTSSLNSTNRATLLEENSIHNVFNNELVALGYPQAEIDVYLAQTQAPGYFSSIGFLNAGTSPGTSYDAIQSSMENLTPYSPVSVTNLTISFKIDDAL